MSEQADEGKHARPRRKFDEGTFVFVRHVHAKDPGEIKTQREESENGWDKSFKVRFPSPSKGPRSSAAVNAEKPRRAK